MREFFCSKFQVLLGVKKFRQTSFWVLFSMKKYKEKKRKQETEPKPNTQKNTINSSKMCNVSSQKSPD